MLCVSSFQTQSEQASNSQSAQSTFPSLVGGFSSLDGPMNQNHLGANNKRAVSEPHTSSQKASSSRFPESDMQTSVHSKKMDSRYNNNGDMSSSQAGFMNGSFHESGGNGRAHNQNNSYGAQYSSQAEKPKGYENNNSESPYSGWQGLNASVSSSSSSNGWNIPDANNPPIGRSIHSNHESLTNSSHDENMVVDSDSGFPSLLGATGGVDNSYSDEKSNNGCNNFLGNSRSMHMPRLGLLGGGENSQSSGWSGSQGATSAVSGWNGRQNGGSSDNTANPENMVVDNEMGYSGLLGATGSSEGKPGGNTYRQETSIPPPRTGLLGGGEGNLNSGWGANAAAGWAARPNTGGPPEMTSGAGSSPTKPQQQASWAQAAGKGLNPALGGTNVQGTSLEPSAEGESTNTAKDRAEEQAKELRLKAAFSEGWGQNTVNQESSWDVPASPPPEPGKENASVWRAPVNNGTEIWENNLRITKGTAVAPPVSTAPPWGHTPATNIGGHWGDDDASNNMWNGAPQNNMNNSTNWSGVQDIPEIYSGNSNEKQWSGNQQPGAWNETSGAGSDNGTTMWNAGPNNGGKGRNWSPMATPKKEVPPTGWEPPSPTPHRRPPSSANYDDGTGVWGNPQRQGKVSHWKDMPSAKPIMNAGGQGVMPPMSGMPGGNGIRYPPNNQKMDMPPVEMWSNKKPPPVTGRLNWQDNGQHHRDAGMWSDDAGHNPMKQMGGTGGNPQGAPQGYWNNEQQANNPLAYWGAKPKANANWADGQVDTSSWLGPAKQRGEMMQEGWSAMSEDISDNAYFENDIKKDSTFGYWNEDKSTQQAQFRGLVGRKLKGGKPLCRDLIWASKQFRLLIELGFKKDEVENALRNNNMAFDDALAELRSGVESSGMMDVDNYGGGRKVRPATANEDMSEHNLDSSFNSFHGGQNAYQGMNYPASQSYKQQVHKQCPTPNNANVNLLSALAAGQQASMASLGNLSPAVVHKILQQQQQQPYSQPNMAQNPFGNANSGGGGGRGGVGGQTNFPSTAQLRHLVQQIQMAVQAGHLNPQLLQQIKVLSQLQQQQVYSGQHLGKPAVPGQQPNSGGGLQLNVQVTQTKQRIVNLQNQIAAQQAVFLKTQLPPNQQPQQQQPPNLAAPPPSLSAADAFKPQPGMEPMPGTLHSEFRDLSLKESHGNQSRLTQWKLSPFEKEDNNPPMDSANSSNPGDFSRAPGPSSKAASGLHPLLGQGDAWSSLAPGPPGASGWPDSIAPSSAASDVNSSSNATTMGSSEPKDTSVTTPVTSASYNLTDLVPEFEPGKPWKGTQMKSIEDDPHITPGSITRSPLSVNTIKDSNLFWNSKNPSASDAGAGGLSSSTWVYNQAQSQAANNLGSQMKSTNSKSNNWGPMTSSDLVSGSEIWSSSKSRGPPPGLSSQGWDHQASSTFLILRNLTPQIDGSTLKTLCMQHGPLQLFHLSLNRGVALVRYSSREEACKAQAALNNCVLGNTTMLADHPSDQDIQQHLQMQVSSGQNASSGNSVGGGGGGGGGGWSSAQPSGAVSGAASYYGGAFAGGANNGAKDTSWNNPAQQLWSFSNNSLWGNGASDHDQTATSYLPGDLLGGDTM